MIPLYTYPGQTWEQVITEKNSHPEVPIIVIVNPQNGSGNAQDSNYVAGIRDLQSAGIMVLGYVHTNYANRDLALTMNDTRKYRDWYGVDGIFFDEMSNVAGDEEYYSSLNNHAKSIGLSFTVGNSGVDTSPNYVGIMDNIVIYDNQGLPSLNFLGGWHTGYDKNNFSFLSYGVQTYDQTFAKKASNYVRYMYLSNGTMPNPWGVHSPHLSNLINSIEEDVALSVNSTTNSGSALTGFWTEIYSSDVLVRTGFTPGRYGLIPGLEYLVCVGDYENYIFERWEDGAAQRCKMITPMQNVAITAQYNTIMTEPPNPLALVVQSVDGAGNVVTGLWTTIYSGVTLIKSGYTTLTYTANAQTQYNVCVSSYQRYVFDRWEDGSTNRCRIITPVENTTITAQYDVHTVLTVRSADANGESISGMWTEIYSNGTMVKSGFTPEQYMLSPTLQYVVCIGDYQTYLFDHWEDGSTNRCRTISDLQSDLTVTAYYNG
ncbi:spherulation-specific family 4 protein [Candidatus Nitrosotenuis cloacae]|jgi:hypothetical protein|uniref:spherulation-specific family 4 protein n=1 Tax=Candidatus Nitrosotenuis cloacae TaxID=1603555 RepID=UPI0022829450|nr:spherulation-specific family 4 protein [Candidatus Nitrosotenuis cloacae]